jgi:hypothetical protein
MIVSLLREPSKFSGFTSGKCNPRVAIQMAVPACGEASRAVLQFDGTAYPAGRPRTAREIVETIA